MFGNGFYNPYLYQPFYQTAGMASNIGNAASSTLGAASRSGIAGGLGKGLLSKFSFSGFLNGASRTLNVVNQAIPIFYQVRPMINNAKTMFKIMGAVKDDGKSNKNTSTSTRRSNTIVPNSSNGNNSQNTVLKNSTTDSDLSLENPVFFI